LGQSETAKVRALIESSIAGNEKGNITSGTYQSMEEIRYGAVPGLKGVQVRLEQPVCSGQNGALWLVNETGEPWTYKVIDRKGPLVTQGSTGYNRKIGNLQPGNYLIQFIHANGLSVLDNFTVKEGKELEFEIISTPQLTEINSTAVKFHVNAQAGLEYEWDFGDGQIAFNKNTVVHNFARPGSYMVKCTVGNFDCKVQKDIEVLINGPASFAEQKD
jgi:PKD repeat protein